MDKALEDAYRLIDPSGTGFVTERQFVDFINECDLEEIVGCFTGQTGPLDVPSRLPSHMMFDPSSLPKDTGAVKVGQIKYRDYNQTLE